MNMQLSNKGATAIYGLGTLTAVIGWFSQPVLIFGMVIVFSTAIILTIFGH